jgi:hypothetical protein
MLGFDFAFADRFRRALATGRRAQRIAMEREMKKAAQLRRWTDEQFNALLGLLQEHAGYLYGHGHALALAQHVLSQACAKVNSATAAAFFFTMKPILKPVRCDVVRPSPLSMAARRVGHSVELCTRDAAHVN